MGSAGFDLAVLMVLDNTRVLSVVRYAIRAQKGVFHAGTGVPQNPQNFQTTVRGFPQFPQNFVETAGSLAWPDGLDTGVERS